MSYLARVYWSIEKGIQTLKEILTLHMQQTADAASLSKLWADTFDNTDGIDAVNSSGYSYDAGNKEVNYNSAQVDAVPDMTSLTAPSGVVLGTVDAANAWKAFDDLSGDSTGWTDGSHSGLPQQLRYDFGASNSKIITKYTLTARSVVADRSPRNFTLEGSNDASGWTVLDTQASQVFSASEKKTYTISNSTAYRYYRLNVSSVSSGDEVNLSEMELMTAAAASAVLQSVQVLNLSADVDEVIVFAEVSGGSVSLIEVSTDDGSTWDTVANLEELSPVTPGAQLKLRLTFTGSLQSWGLAA